MRRCNLCLCLLLTLPGLAQVPGINNPSSAAPVIDCLTRKSADAQALKSGKGFINLAQATALVVDAINEAKCANFDPAGRFQLTTADMDFQTLVDHDGTLEVLFIGGAAGELDKQVTADSDFTYSVPTPVGAQPFDHSEFLSRLAKSKTKEKASSATTLGEAITAAMQQMAERLNDFPALSQHQVKVSIKFAFTKDGTLELEPKIGSVGITGKYKISETNTQTITLTFADQTPIINLSATPASPITQGTSITLIASVVPPANSTVIPNGNVTFLDGNVSLGVKPLNSGFAGIVLPTLAPGIHSFTAVYGADTVYDSIASTATVMVVGPSIIQP